MIKCAVYFTKTAVINVEVESEEDAEAEAWDIFSKTGEFDHVWDEWVSSGLVELED